MASFYDFALVCQALEQTQSRNQMVELVADFLSRLDAGEAAIAARFMVGQPLAPGAGERLQVSGSALWKVASAIVGGADDAEDIFAAAVDFGEAIETVLRRRPEDPSPTLSLAEVARRFDEIAAIEGRNSRRRKLGALGDLLRLSSALEGRYVAKILVHELRHGVREGLMLEALARMAGRPADEVRRLHMAQGDVGRVTRILREGGASVSPMETVAADRPRALKPMLAQPARNVADAFAILGPHIALEHKLDGARVQIHCRSDAVRIFSRRMNDITLSLPEVVQATSALAHRGAILDGEVIAIDREGRPRAFQEVMRRFGRCREIDRLSAEQPVALYVFDLLGLNGELTIDLPYQERYAALGELAGPAGLALAGRIVPASADEGERFYEAALAAGFEGVMAKELSSRYTPGVRGSGWLKIKRADTLDLVIVAADWGYGRRKGWLSNYHLAARDEAQGSFAAVGKTFKGLTDEEFRDLTERLLALRRDEAHGTVFVKPEIVVEVAYSDIQRSPSYPCGMTLRFARIVGIRNDKSQEEADTLATVTERFERQVLRPA